MIINSKKKLAIIVISSGLSSFASAGFYDDSAASLEFRNYYLSQKFRNKDAVQPKIEDWAQGFLFRYSSGFTDGPIGFGLDASAFAGLRLDSGRGRTGTELMLPKNSNGKVPREYSELAGTLKTRIGDTGIRLGTLEPNLPVISANHGRLLPQTFRGIHITSKEIKNTTIDIGHVDRFNQRNSTNNEPLKISLHPGKRNTSNYKKSNPDVSNSFLFAGAKYNFNDINSISYHYGKLKGVYNQHVLNSVTSLISTERHSLTADLRFAYTKQDKKSGINNKSFSGMLNYKSGMHKLDLGFQKMSGDTGYVSLAVSNPYLVNYIQYNNFAATDERSWQVRYGYNFAKFGLENLNFGINYVQGRNIYMGKNQSRGKEWERDTSIGYTFKEGPLKNLSINWINVAMKSDVLGDLHENNVIITYKINFL